MTGLPEWKLKILVDAVQALFDREPAFDLLEDDAASPGDWTKFADECGDDIVADLIVIQTDRRKGRRKQAQQKYNLTEAGQAARKAWNESAAGTRKAWRESSAGKASAKAWRESPAGRATIKAWSQTETGRAAKRRERNAWKKTESGKQSGNATKRKKGLEQYLNRRIVTLDSEGRAPLHTIDAEGRSPLDAYKATGCKKYLTFDGSGLPWEPHELSLIGAATVTRPYGTPLQDGIWEPPVWREMVPKRQSEQAFEFLLSLPERFPNEANLSKPSLFVMFMASYDWSMWLRDTPFGKAFEIARQRGFAPPCRRMRGHVFWKKYAIKVRPFYDFKLSELRWPDDPYGKLHKTDPAYKKPAKGQKAKLQVIRRITITDTFRNAPGPFVEAIRPMMTRGLIPRDVFDVIEREKKKRGSFHLEPIANVKEYCGHELHTLCVFMHMLRDACWTANEIRLKSFHSPAAIASVLLERIDVRGHSWPVKSTSADMEYEQEIAHWSYFGGRFEWVLKGYNKAVGYQIDLASAYPYAMQFLPSMAGGSWEKLKDKEARDLIRTPKRIFDSCILSIYRVRFNFYADASFYPLPLRLENGTILFPRIGWGYYTRDDLLNAIDWCRKYRIPIKTALIIEEANLFHPALDAPYPFTLIADIYDRRIEFDKRDPKGPEQAVLKGGMNSVYGKLAEKRYRGDDEDGNPIIPPHACPWYASCITSHTRRELMKAALTAQESIIGFATDAIYSEHPLDLPRLKAEADIKAGREDKLLGDWCWSQVPGAVFIQSGLAVYLDENGKVVEVKCRGLPIKNRERARKFVDDVLVALAEPYDPDAVPSFKPRKDGRPIARHATVEIRAFMPVASAIVSPKKFKTLFCKWGDVTKTIWLDDCGGKRTIDPDDLNLIGTQAVPTRPRENPRPETLSALRFPDWVENKIREEKRQEAAIIQFYKIEEEKENSRYLEEDVEYNPYL